MEKGTPHYSLKAIQAQMSELVGLRLTSSARSARSGLHELSFDVSDAIAAIGNLRSKDLRKSMTTYADYRVWQDVYTTEYRGERLYIKFQQDESGYFTVSFKAL